MDAILTVLILKDNEITNSAHNIRFINRDVIDGRPKKRVHPGKIRMKARLNLWPVKSAWVALKRALRYHTRGLLTFLMHFLEFKTIT